MKSEKEKKGKMKSENNAIIIPEGLLSPSTGGTKGSLLLHACCAPCSSAIVEWMLQHDIRPTIFYFNPNIYPRQEYEIRKNESKRHADSLGIPWIDGDYDHQAWLQQIQGLEHEPERGARCLQCFRIRLTATALQAQKLGISHFATTLASSRWKNLEQINQAGLQAQQHLASLTTSSHPLAPSPSLLTPPSVPLFWPQNWRKAGLQERRNQLLKQYSFYNQRYCGCEFSYKPAEEDKTAPPHPASEHGKG